MKIRLQYWRTKKVLSIDMLAKEAKVSPATIVNIEKGRHTPHPGTLRKLAQALGITIEQLVVDESEERAA